MLKIHPLDLILNCYVPAGSYLVFTKLRRGGEVEIFMPITVLLLRATYLVKETVGQEFFLCIAWV
jgi:hypothetical protein